MSIVRRILIIVAIIGIYIVAEVWMAHRVTPPAHLQTFAQFMAWHPNNRAYFIHQTKGHEYLEVLGSSGRVLSSGWGGYIFDESGHLIEWCKDSGDNTSYQKRWQESGTRQGITRDEAVAKYATTRPDS